MSPLDEIAGPYYEYCWAVDTWFLIWRRAPPAARQVHAHSLIDRFSQTN